MFVDVDVRAMHAPAIEVPSDAIIDSGRTRTVFVERRSGVFERGRSRRAGAPADASRS
jgi:hypothetical protein